MRELHDEPLAGYTTMRVGGPAARMVVAETTDELVDAVREVDDADEPLLVLGGGSNLVLPDEGRGELRTQSANGSHLTELEITSPHSKGGEYFLYGSETSADGSGVAWSAYRWRGEEKRKRDRVRGEDVVDVAAGIRVIRERQPQGSMRMRIWWSTAT